MASLIKNSENPLKLQATDTGYAELSSHPMFEDLQATLVTDCLNHTLPYTFCQNDAPDEPPVDGALAAVEEANLQSQFQKMATKHNSKVTELQTFYNSQCTNVESDRFTAISDLKARNVADMALYQVEVAKIHAVHDRRRMHLTRRVTESLTLLQTSLPDMADSTTKTKPRQLNSKGVKVMTDWWERHQDNPYPSEEEKDMLAREGNLSLAQVKAWFANRRNRTSNTKPKKQKQQVEKKLLSICSELTGDCAKAPRMYGDIIKQLSDIVNSSTIFNQNLVSKNVQLSN